MATYDDEFLQAQDLAVAVAPEYARYIRWWIPYARPGIDRFAIRNSRDFFFNPELPPEVIAAELIHLSHHIVQRHDERGADELRFPNRTLWHIATCLEVVEAWDEKVKEAGLEWGPGTDQRDRFQLPGRMKAEEIYDWLDKNLSEEEKQQLQKEQQQGQKPDQQQQGQGQGQPGQGQPGQGQPGQGQPGQGRPGQGQPGQGQPGQGQPGQGQPGQGQPGQGQPGQGQQGMGEGDGPGFCRFEDYDIDRDAIEKGQEGQGQEGEGQDGQGQGQGQGKDGDGQGQGKDGDGQGKQPGPPGSQDADLQRESDPRKRRSLMWLKIYKFLMRGSKSLDFSLTPPSNRSPDDMAFSKVQQQPEEIGILIDVSSSVNDAQLQIMVEIAATIGRQQRDIKVALGNTKVVKTGGVKLLGNVRGSGGTSFETVIPEAYRKLGKPSRFLVITDGETKWPDAAKLPPNTVIVVLNDKNVLANGYYSSPAAPAHIRRRAVWVRFSDLAAPKVKDELGRPHRRSGTPDASNLAVELVGAATSWGVGGLGSMGATARRRAEQADALATVHALGCLATSPAGLGTHAGGRWVDVTTLQRLAMPNVQPVGPSGSGLAE